MENENNMNTGDSSSDMNPQGKSKVWMAVSVIILILIIVLVVRAKKPDSEIATNGAPGSSDDALVVTEDISAGSVDLPDVKSTTPPVSYSYAEALVKFKDKRIQLEESCQAIPRTMTFKNNTNIMLDNRAKVGRRVKIGDVITVKAYGFKIINISSAKLPATWYVDCDASQNVATILIQK